MDHQHALLLISSEAPSYMCSCCKEIGFGSCYTCVESNCNYTLHYECAEPVKHAVHPFFKNCTFEFYDKTVEDGFCDACGKDLLGCFYFSRAGDALHPCCLSLEKNISDKMTLSHQVPSDCVMCKQRHVQRNNFEGWSYVFNSDGKTCVHVSCWNDVILETFNNNKSKETVENLNSKSKGRKRAVMKFTGKLALNMLLDIATGDVSNSISTIVEAIEALAS
ncbi:uncharacterized protein LOC131613406 [Vicia villosa]|uniref:uncharacterized protein LOC131613406 n=1 Tax=Vicia villosa TaxID=3911 RepID=UPI00273AE446|nr:uncharacterized protein LOC131613406 [Vicia villosa]